MNFSLVLYGVVGTSCIESNVTPWSTYFRLGNARFPPFSCTPANLAPGVCATVHLTPTAHAVQYNTCCHDQYRTAAVGHLLLAFSNATFLPITPDDMLSVPLGPTPTVSYESVHAMAPAYGKVAMCTANSHCRMSERCVNHACTHDTSAVKWGLLGLALLLVTVMMVTCGWVSYRLVSDDTYAWTHNYAGAFEPLEDEIELLDMNITETPHTVARIDTASPTAPLVVTVNNV